MRLNVPLLPIVIDVRWRVLGPPRISLRGLMLTVGVIALFLSLCSYMGRLNRAITYHHEQARKAARNPFPYRSLGSQTGDAQAVNWHTAMENDYLASYAILEPIPSLFFVMIVGICVCALLGRVLNVFASRSVIPTRLGEQQRVRDGEAGSSAAPPHPASGRPLPEGAR